jgi:cell division protein FtsL
MKKRRPLRGISVGGTLLQLLPVAMLILVFVAVGIVHVTSRVLVVHAGYRMSQLEVESRSLAREHDQLRLERATLLSPARLERLAQEKLGLVPPPAGSVIAARRGPGAPLPLQPATAQSRGDGPTAVRVANRGGR